MTEDPLTAERAVLDANQRFYDAFEASDLDAMSDVWSHQAGIACTHPGWGTLHGWAEISSSWFALFQQPSPLQFILTNAAARVVGDLAWVTLDENLIGDGEGQTMAAVNVFQRVEQRWLMVCHHGGLVAPAPRVSRERPVSTGHPSRARSVAGRAVPLPG